METSYKEMVTAEASPIFHIWYTPLCCYTHSITLLHIFTTFCIPSWHTKFTTYVAQFQSAYSLLLCYIPCPYLMYMTFGWIMLFLILLLTPMLTQLFINPYSLSSVKVSELHNVILKLFVYNNSCTRSSSACKPSFNGVEKGSFMKACSLYSSPKEAMQHPIRLHSPCHNNHIEGFSQWF